MSEMIDTKIRQHLSRFRVGIAGCGGLGSNCGVALARVGIGELVIVDFDVVEKSNLNRQYYFLKQVGLPKTEALQHNISLIDPTVRITSHNTTIKSDNVAELFGGCDVVVEAFDRADQKVMLIESMSLLLPDTPLISGSGMAGWGNNHLIRCEQYGNLYVCGDQQTEVSPDVPPLAPRVGIVASMQANFVMEILMRKKV